MSDSTPLPLGRICVVGQGRLGTALAHALREAGADVDGPCPRGTTGVNADLVLLCVPDREIAAAAAVIGTGPLVGHCSGATTLEVLDGREAFSLHPLMTVTGPGAPLRGAGAAVAGSSPHAIAVARALAATLGMHAVQVDDADRAAYHAAAAIASNFLLAVEDAAEALMVTAGGDRALLVALVQATVANWAADGAAASLTGPIARGDDATVAAHRAAVAQRTPDRLALFDALTAATRRLAAPEAVAAA